MAQPVVVACLAVCVAAGLALSAPAAPDPGRAEPTGPRSIGQHRDAPDGVLVLAVHSPERAVVADPRTGATSARRLAGGTLCHGTLLAVGDRVILAGSRGGASGRALTAPHAARPRSLARAG